jgi:hypothetical protein
MLDSSLQCLSGILSVNLFLVESVGLIMGVNGVEISRWRAMYIWQGLLTLTWSMYTKWCSYQAHKICSPYPCKSAFYLDFLRVNLSRPIPIIEGLPDIPYLERHRWCPKFIPEKGGHFVVGRSDVDARVLKMPWWEWSIFWPATMI